MSRLLEIRPSSGYITSDSNKVKRRKFDVDSGQVYTEMTCRAAPMTADWVWKTKESTKSVRRFRFIGPGCASLENMAIRSIIANSSSLTAESIQDIPWHIAEKIWQRFRILGLDSLHVWRVFATAYPGRTDKELNHRSHVVTEPNMPLGLYVKPLSSPSFHWIVHLSILDVTYSRAELFSLSKLVNIGALSIGSSRSGSSIEDRIIRAWARAATETGAFSMLRVLILKAQKDITPQSFVYLNQFPSLTLFNTEDCNLGPKTKAEALALGWKYRTGKRLTDFLVNGGLTNASWDSIMHASFRQAGSLTADRMGKEAIEAIDSLPVLHFCLGCPPKEAALELKTAEGMRCFQRVNETESQRQSTVANRQLADDHRLHMQPAKRPMIRTTKLRDYGDLAMEFRS